MKLCIALDQEKEANLKLLNDIKGFNDIWVKVGFRSFIRDGIPFLNQIKDYGFKIFLDLKLYDIPNTMAKSAKEISNIGIDMFNIHASSGYEAMKMVVEELKDTKNKPLILAVTALTSFDNDSFKKIYNKDIDILAKEFAISSYKAGIDGVVCSAFESKEIKLATSKDFITLTPGIRPFNENANDQKRVANIAVAKENLVDFIVVGRAIYQDKNPKEKVEKILNEIG